MEIALRPCDERDVGEILAVINDAAEAYRDAIPAAVWKDPYMPAEELRDELGAGVRFTAAVVDRDIVGVMGLQLVRDVALIRHAYVRTTRQRRGIGAALLEDIRRRTSLPLLIGTWRDATWAIRFYERHGFRLVPPGQTRALLRRYWTVPERQIASSVVLADDRWAARVT